MRNIRTIKSSIEEYLQKPITEVPIIELVDMLVEYAYASHASDIHIEPTKGPTRIRLRVDGLLRDEFEKFSVLDMVQQEIISRIKILSGLRIDEHFLPQDGRFKVTIEDFGDMDVRVSIMPTYYGENAILRILASTQNFNIEDLNFNEKDFVRLQKAIQKPYGMILANGPTGSGKTTTLYTILKRLNRPDVSVITLEDPIEYSLSGTTQIQTNSKIGLTFANGLRSILRQDPNIIMVGEIRDEETASIAVNAALTGHLVLSTLHTNDSATTFPRLIDMGIPPFLVASTINIASGQRLVRMICPKCKYTRTMTTVEINSLAEIIPETREIKDFYAGKGCAECNDTGYQGRMGIREVLDVTNDIRQLVLSKASAQEIKEQAVKDGMTTMLTDGLQKVAAGQTSIEEIIRIIHE